MHSSFMFFNVSLLFDFAGPALLVDVPRDKNLTGIHLQFAVTLHFGDVFSSLFFHFPCGTEL